MADDDGYEPSTYGDRIAEVYDERYPVVPSAPDVATTIDFLAPLAGAGPALELGIGTGRVAIPLAAAGVEVHGIDASAAMVERMRAKPGGEAIPVTIGDFRDFSLDTTFTAIYVPFNTFFGLLSQDDYVSCFLRPGARSDGEARRTPPARTMGRLGSDAVLRSEREAHLGLGARSRRLSPSHRRRRCPAARRGCMDRRAARDP